MIAHRLIEDAKAVGLSIEIDGGDLIVEADRDPPGELIARLRAHKAEVIAFLLPQRAGAGVGAIEPSKCEGNHPDVIGEPTLLRDGRRLYRFRAFEDCQIQSGNAAALADDARFRGAVLVADGHELIVVLSWRSTLPEETLRALKDNAGSVIAVLLGESRQRTRLRGLGRDRSRALGPVAGRPRRW
jgi:hypothetical protein